MTTRYVRGNAIDQLFSRIDSGGTAAHYFVDHLGSVRHMTDGSGTLQNTIAYDGFGNITSESSPSFGDRYTYASRERDVETGFYYNRARYYNPEVGRWTSEDPLGFGAGDSNLYRYVTNQPTGRTDPSGLADDDWVHPFHPTAQWSLNPADWRIGQAASDIGGSFVRRVDSVARNVIPAPARAPSVVHDASGNAIHTGSVKHRVVEERKPSRTKQKSIHIEASAVESLLRIKGHSQNPQRLVPDFEIRRPQLEHIQPTGPNVGTLTHEKKGPDLLGDASKLVHDVLYDTVDYTLEPVRMGGDLIRSGEVGIVVLFGGDPYVPDYASRLGKEAVQVHPLDNKGYAKLLAKYQTQNLRDGLLYGGGGYVLGKVGNRIVVAFSRDAADDVLRLGGNGFQNAPRARLGERYHFDVLPGHSAASNIRTPFQWSDAELQGAVDSISRAAFGANGVTGVPISVTVTRSGRVVVSQARQVPNAAARARASEIFGENVEFVRGTTRSNAPGVRGGDAEARAIHFLGDEAQGARQATTHYACPNCEARQTAAGVINVTGTQSQHGQITRPIGGN